MQKHAGDDLFAAVGSPSGNFRDFGIRKVIPDPHYENILLFGRKIIEVFHDFRKFDLTVDVFAEIGRHGSGFEGFVELFGNRFRAEVVDRGIVGYGKEPRAEFRLGIAMEGFDFFQGLEKGFLGQVFRNGLVKRFEIQEIVNLFDVGFVEGPERFEVSFAESPHILVGHRCQG